MKKRTVFAGIISLVLVFGLLLLTGCPTEGGGGGEPVKSIKIENITSLTGDAGIGIFSEMPTNNEFPSFTAIRYGFIDSGILTVELTIPNNNTYENPSNPWKGKGEYYVIILPVVNNSVGQNVMLYVGDGNAPVKVNIVNEVTTLNFDKFVSVN